MQESARKRNGVVSKGPPPVCHSHPALRSVLSRWTDPPRPTSSALQNRETGLRQSRSDGLAELRVQLAMSATVYAEIHNSQSGSGTSAASSLSSSARTHGEMLTPHIEWSSMAI
jgi:hypothetical protein